MMATVRTWTLTLPKLGYRSVSGLFLLAAAIALALSDLAVSALNPWAEMHRLVAGLIWPDLLSIEAMSVVWTVAFAVLGVALGASSGFMLALVFARLRAVRLLSRAWRRPPESSPSPSPIPASSPRCLRR